LLRKQHWEKTQETLDAMQAVYRELQALDNVAGMIDLVGYDALDLERFSIKLHHTRML
jgi:hypothetical protein